MSRQSALKKRGERGVSFLLVVAGMFAILAMAALAVDVVIIYTARSEAQKAADAAALAGAKVFVNSGITSGSALANICGGGTDASNMLAGAAAQSNNVMGIAAAVTNVTCNLADLRNPRITVTVSRNDLPTFFGRIFGRQVASVSATATAEAFNNSGGTTQVNIGSVKPWLVPNCDPGAALDPLTGCAPPANYYFDPANNYALNNPAAYMGLQRNFNPYPDTNGPYFVIDPMNQAPQPMLCPSFSVAGCPASVGSGGYLDDIACANQNSLQCGSTVQVSLLNNNPATRATTVNGAQCLMHTAIAGNQDTFSVAGPPVVITGGTANLNASFRNVANISRSDSVVNLPVFEWQGAANTPCPGGNCTGTETVVGFLQVGINDVVTAGPNQGRFSGVILNAVGCNPASTGNGITAGALTPVPVRLVQ
jgi:Putative Flp pilus-assembly TadE/G-like